MAANQQPPSARSASHTPSTATLESQTSNLSSASNSATQSPLGSRESSPTRNPRRAASFSKLGGTRSRKNSQQDQSPSRLAKSNLPGPISSSKSLSAANLSSKNTPVLLPATQDPQIRAPTPQKPSVLADQKDSPRWPVSPRLRSPPPQLNKPSTSARRTEQETPAINLQRPSPSPQLSDSQTSASESDADDAQTPAEARTPARRGLETVQEVSLPNSPTPNGDASLLEQVKEKLLAPDSQSESTPRNGRPLQPRANLVAQESGSDSSSMKVDAARRTSSVPAPLVSRQSSGLSTKQLKSKQDSAAQNVTVETETVTSIPQVALASNTKPEGPNGTLRAKPSTETIKPKKDKKKSVRKQAAISSGNASSKADIFEAKIASAVDEANTSDSEETFVYDSNPPDTAERGGRRFHSRTPSATSMASQADRPNNVRSIYGVMEGGGPAPKKNMKFVNSYNGSAGETSTPGEEEGKNTGRSVGSGRGTARHHHHIGRWGRQAGNGHASILDNESPFPSLAKTKMNGAQSRNSSGPPSPRNHHLPRGHLGTKRSGTQISASYDLDDTTGADDERTPLIGTGRQARRYNRRGPHSLRQAESQTFTRRSSYLNRFAACLVLTMMLLLVITGAIGFMFATSQPMTDIGIVSIKNVVTSEQVLMFDVTVKAHNPNIVVVTIDQANLEIFAKSEHAGTDSDWWESPHGPPTLGPFDDPPDDLPRFPGDDDDGSKPNVLLGRITEFDSPLTFEGSLFHKGTSASTGEMQLPYPGNSTSGGSKRWERIYQNEFDLIVKGVVKYSLPLSAHIRSATVSGRTTVKPNSANDPSLQPNSTITQPKN